MDGSGEGNVHVHTLMCVSYCMKFWFGIAIQAAERRGRQWRDEAHARKHTDLWVLVNNDTGTKVLNCIPGGGAAVDGGGEGGARVHARHCALPGARRPCGAGGRPPAGAAPARPHPGE